MIPKHIAIEVERTERAIKLKKERIEKLKRLAKLGKNPDLISEYDAIAKQAEDAIFAILDSKDVAEAGREQVVLRRNAGIRLMAKGLKASLCESEKQIEALNNSIEDDNIKIEEAKNRKNYGGKIT